MKQIAVIGAILENPHLSQQPFNETVSDFKGIVKGRLGIPFDQEDMAVISLTLVGSQEQIEDLTDQLDALDHVTVKAAISDKTIEG